MNATGRLSQTSIEESNRVWLGGKRSQARMILCFDIENPPYVRAISANESRERLYVATRILVPTNGSSVWE